MELKDLDLKKLLDILAGLGAGADALGVPFAELTGDVAAITNKWVKRLAEEKGETEQQTIANAIAGAEGNEAALLADLARLHAEEPQ